VTFLARMWTQTGSVLRVYCVVLVAGCRVGYCMVGGHGGLVGTYVQQSSGYGSRI
jgi:hypothetical protein